MDKNQLLNENFIFVFERGEYTYVSPQYRGNFSDMLNVAKCLVSEKIFFARICVKSENSPEFGFTPVFMDGFNEKWNETHLLAQYIFNHPAYRNDFEKIMGMSHWDVFSNLD